MGPVIVHFLQGRVGWFQPMPWNRPNPKRIPGRHCSKQFHGLISHLNGVLMCFSLTRALVVGISPTQCPLTRLGYYFHLRFHGYLGTLDRSGLGKKMQLLNLIKKYRLPWVSSTFCAQFPGVSVFQLPTTHPKPMARARKPLVKLEFFFVFFLQNCRAVKLAKNSRGGGFL